MATSDKTFNQVRAILGKLDQRIDSLRERRVSPPPPAAPHPSLQQTVGQAEAPKPAPQPGVIPNGPGPVIGAPAAPAAAAPASPANPIGTTVPTTGRSSSYGRATPLRNVS